MTPSAPENPPDAAARPAYLPWYVHVLVMALLMLAMLGLTVVFGIAIYAMLIGVAWTAICLAVAGERNRLLFSGVLVAAGVLTAVGFTFLRSTRAEAEVPLGLLLFGLAPLWPALLLWLAHTLNTRRRKR